MLPPSFKVPPFCTVAWNVTASPAQILSSDAATVTDGGNELSTLMDISLELTIPPAKHGGTGAAVISHETISPLASVELL